MVVVFLFDAFTCNELLAGRLVSFGRALTTRSLVPRENSLVSSIGRILYWFIDSNTGDWAVVEVVKTCPSSRGGGIFECAIGRMSVKICKEDASSNEVPSSLRDRPAEERGPPVYMSLVITAESSARRPTLLPPRREYSQLTAPLAPCQQSTSLPSSLGNPCSGAPSRCI